MAGEDNSDTSGGKSVEVVPVMSKITEHKLCSTNYVDWRQTIDLYLLSISMDHHVSDEVTILLLMKPRRRLGFVRMLVCSC